MRRLSLFSMLITFGRPVQAEKGNEDDDYML
jgi:hypothetical protein